jgi:hypothetical protein
MGKKQTRKQQRGGVISIGDNPTETLNKFQVGSKINYLSSGLSGLVFTCENTKTSDYYAFRPNNLATNVTKIILKLCIIHNATRLSTEFDGRGFISIREDEFLHEIYNQTDIVNATCGYFEPSMPTILFTKSTDNFDNVMKMSICAQNEKTTAIFDQLFQSLLSLPGLKLGIIAMEHAGINETFQQIFHLGREARQHAEALAMYELIILGVHGFYHGDHHDSNLLYSDNSTADYFLSDDGSLKWYTGKRVLLIDAGRVSRLDRKGERTKFNNLFEKFRIKPDPDVLGNIIQMIMNGGFEYDHKQSLKNHELYAWFNKNGRELSQIAGYVHELMNARMNAISHVVERTRSIVTDTFDGTADMNIIKQFVVSELQKKKARGSTLDIIKKQLTFNVIQNIKKQIPHGITQRVALLKEYIRNHIDGIEEGEIEDEDEIEEEIKEDEEEEIKDDVDLTEKQRGDKQKMVGGENEEIFKFIGPIDLNELVQISCFAIIFAMYLTGKFNYVEPSFVTLTMSFYKREQRQSFATEKQEILFEQMPPLVSVGAGGKHKKTRRKQKKTRCEQKKTRQKHEKTRRKQKGGVITRSGRELSGLNGPARKERQTAKQPQEVCAICLQPLTGKIISCPNGHMFHENCIREWCRIQQRAGTPCNCPTCRALIQQRGVSPIQQIVVAPAPAVAPLQALYAPGQGGQEITGRGFPPGLRFTLLPPGTPNSGETGIGDRRWPHNYRPTPQEISDWGIRMTHYWWTDGNLPLGWYREHAPITTYYGSIDPYYRGEHTIVYPGESYRDGLADAPNWMIIPAPPPPSPPPSPQEGCSIM